MPLSLVLTIAAGGASAAMYLSLLAGPLGTFLLAYFAQLPLVVVGLILGVAPAALAASAGIVLALAAGGLVFGLLFALINAMPALVLVRQTLLNRGDGKGGTEWYPPGHLVAGLCAIACLAFGVAVLLAAGYDDGLEGYIRVALADVFGKMAHDGGAAEGGRAPTDTIVAGATAMARFIPGAVAASWMVMTAVNGILAQAIAVRARRNLRPTPRMADIELPSWVMGLTAIAGIGALLPGTAGFVGVNLIVILGVGFVFAGLAVVHAVTASWRQRRWWLVAIYLSVFTMAWMPWLVVFIALIGFLEPWAKLRARWAGPSRES